MCQNYHLISRYENDTHTVVTFSRAWDTCDDQDLALGHDTARLIWAYSEEDPGEGGSPLLYHSLTQRGQRSIYLSESPAPSAPLPSLKVWDLLLPTLTMTTLVQDIPRPGGDHQAPHDRSGAHNPDWSQELLTCLTWYSPAPQH